MLPPKREWVIKCRLSPIQSKLYKHFLRYRRAQSLQFEQDDAADFEEDNGDEDGAPTRKNKKGAKANKDILAATHITIMIVNHPDVLHKLVKELNRTEDDWIAAGNVSAGCLELCACGGVLADVCCGFNFLYIYLYKYWYSQYADTIEG